MSALNSMPLKLSILLRIDNSQFGICAKCSEPIEKMRLDALAYVNQCIDCSS